MAIVFALGGVLVNWIWQPIGAPRIEPHQDVAESVKDQGGADAVSPLGFSP